mgnify:CR=1 FL=1
MAGSSLAKPDDPDAKDDGKKDKDEKKGTNEDEAEKASSGKILNLVSVDTFRRALSHPL